MKQLLKNRILRQACQSRCQNGGIWRLGYAGAV